MPLTWYVSSVSLGLLLFLSGGPDGHLDDGEADQADEEDFADGSHGICLDEAAIGRKEYIRERNGACCILEVPT